MLQTLSKMGSMRLTTMTNSFEQRSDHNDLSTEEFVGLLIDDEYTARQSRRLSRMIGKANFEPENTCIENKPTRGFLKKDIMQFTQPTWIENAQDLILVGATGTGKTYLGSYQAIKMVYPATKIRVKRLFDDKSYQTIIEISRKGFLSILRNNFDKKPLLIEIIKKNRQYNRTSFMKIYVVLSITY